jgi:hypothetical protein
VSSRPTTGLRFKCGGLHDGGCPDKASIVVAIGTRAQDGLALGMLHAALKGASWALGVGKSPGSGGNDVTWLDPLCPSCARALASEITAGGTAPMSPEARYALEQEAGPLPPPPSPEHRRP